MKNNILRQAFVFAALLAGSAGLSASAAPSITPLDPTAPVLVTSVPNPTTGPDAGGFDSTGEDGYDFFYARNSMTGVNGDVIGASSFATISPYYPEDTVGKTNVYNGYLPITIAGTSYETGVEFANTIYDGTPYDFAMVALGATVPASFDLGILTGNSNGGTDTTLYTLTLYSALGAQLSQSEVNTVPATSGDYFFYADVQGATAGDYIVVSGLTSNDSGREQQIAIGGITLDVPEPSTYALMFAGLGMLLLVARFRRRGTAGL